MFEPEESSATRRYLLFDASCMSCSQTASDVEEQAEGWLMVRGLQEPAMRALLERAGTERFEPTLLVVDGHHVRAYTGVRLTLRLTAGVGPGRTTRILRAIGGAQDPIGPDRRAFLRGTSVAAGAALLPIGWTRAAFAGEERVATNDWRLGQIRRQLTQISRGQNLGPKAFVWDKSAIVEQHKGKDHMIVVPAADHYQSPTERIFLVAPYRPSTDKVGNVAIQLYEREDRNVTDRYQMHFVDPGKRRIVGMSIDEKRGIAQPLTHPMPKLADQPVTLQGYWECVGGCLRNLWPTLPWPTRLLCAAACGGCVFGGQYYACAGCVGCLAGYAGYCLWACR